MKFAPAVLLSSNKKARKPVPFFYWRWKESKRDRQIRPNSIRIYANFTYSTGRNWNRHKAASVINKVDF